MSSGDLLTDQVKAMMRSTREAGGVASDGGKATLLHSAVSSRSKGTFEGVLAALRGWLTREEVGSNSSFRLLAVRKSFFFGDCLISTPGVFIWTFF